LRYERRHVSRGLNEADMFKTGSTLTFSVARRSNKYMNWWVDTEVDFKR